MPYDPRTLGSLAEMPLGKIISGSPPNELAYASSWMGKSAYLINYNTYMYSPYGGLLSVTRVSFRATC